MLTERFHAIAFSLSKKGYGVVSHLDGRTFFVPGLWSGEEGEIEIAQGAASFTQARLVSVQKKSTHRVSVPCAHHGINQNHCSGCPWMFIDYPQQLKAKEKKIDYLLEKYRLKTKKRAPIVPSPKKLHYRNRAQFKTDGKIIGYVNESDKTIIPIKKCHVLNDKMATILSGLQETLPRSDWEPAEGHRWNYLDIDDLQVGHQLTLNRRRPFRQGNEEQNQFIHQWLDHALDDSDKNWPIIDLFSGSGNLTERISQMGFKKILAVEVQGRAVEELKRKNLLHVRILEQDMMKKGAWGIVGKCFSHAKILVLDPPRSGIQKRKGLFKYLNRLEKVIYISCIPETWAQDVSDFVKNGFELSSLTPLDMFPHTPHIELLSILERSR